MNRYTDSSTIPQPKRKIIPSSSDVIHLLVRGERLDNLAKKYYNNNKLAWIILCANPEFENEFEIPIGTKLRIPYPLDRVFNYWRFNEI